MTVEVSSCVRRQETNACHRCGEWISQKFTSPLQALANLSEKIFLSHLRHSRQNTATRSVRAMDLVCICAMRYADVVSVVVLVVPVAQDADRVVFEEKTVRTTSVQLAHLAVWTAFLRIGDSRAETHHDFTHCRN